MIALEHIVKKDFKVLEFGCGGSTVFWANNCSTVKSFETNKLWFEKLKSKFSNNKNVELILAQNDEILKAVDKEPDKYYDLVLIDSEPSKNRRLTFANASLPKLKTGSWLVIDNYMRFSMNDFNYNGFKVYTFDEFNYQGSGTRLCKKLA